MARTITSPVNDSGLTSSIVRSQLQTLEDEVAGTGSGHDHDGTDSKNLVTGAPSDITDGTSASSGPDNGQYSRSGHVHGVTTGTLPFKSGDWILSSVTTARAGWTN